MNPGQVVGPRVVLVLGGEIVTQGAKDAEAAEGAEHGHLRGLIEEAVGWGDTESGSGRRAIAVGALHGTRKADAGFVHQGLAEGGREVEAGHVVVPGERLRGTTT